MNLNQLTIQEHKILSNSLDETLGCLTRRIDNLEEDIEQDEVLLSKGEEPRHCILGRSWAKKELERAKTMYELTANLYQKITGEQFYYVPF